jgi:hypothetical protein
MIILENTNIKRGSKSRSLQVAQSINCSKARTCSFTAAVEYTLNFNNNAKTASTMVYKFYADSNKLNSGRVYIPSSSYSKKVCQLNNVSSEPRYNWSPFTVTIT